MNSIEVRLKDCAAQENCDSEEYDLMQEAANEIKQLREQLAKANERVKELESRCKVVAGLFDDAVDTCEDLISARNKFAIEKKIEMIEEIIKDCQSYSLDGVILMGGVKAKLEQLRKEKE